MDDGIPFTSFAVEDVSREYERLAGLGVRFTQPHRHVGPVTTAVFDDTCGNLIQIAAENGWTRLTAQRSPTRNAGLAEHRHVARIDVRVHLSNH